MIVLRRRVGGDRSGRGTVTGSANWRTRSVVAVLVVVLALLALSTPASAQYPPSLPDFSHPAAPHDPRLSPASGTDSRPLLVIVADFSDVTERVTAAQAQTRFFGVAFGSVNNYYTSESFNRFSFTPAAETEGTANDGVVVAPVGLLANIQTAGNDLGGPWGAQAIAAADQWVDFSSYDANNDDRVDERELAIVVMTDTGDASACGGTRALTAVTVDTMVLTGRQYSYDFALENNITHAHELAHQAFGTQDQFYIAGPYDITAPTCGGNPYFSLNSWHKTHLGWATATVVTRDGYYDVPNWTTSGTSFLLYDHDRGANDYFLVENRVRGGYDQNIADQGLIVWRVDETAFGTRHFDLMRPGGGVVPNNYGGSSADAYDGDDSLTPSRSMTYPWRDGTSAGVAVRAIGDSGPTMRAYFDVRGPGVLVDTYNLLHAAPVDVILGEPGSISVPVMNTGEASDSFAFTASGLPPGWTATTDTRTLAAGAGGTATFTVTPPLTATTGTYTLTATATSTTDGSVTSASTFQVNVLRRPTTIVYTGAPTADYHDPAQLSAVLTDTISGAPLAARTVAFSLGSQSASASTSAEGTASASIVLTQAPGPVALTASFAGDPTYQPSSSATTFTITREQTTTAYTGPLVILQGGSGVTLSARMLEDGTTAPVPFGQTITLSLGGQSCTGTTDSTGLAACTLTFSGPLGPQPLTANFSGDAYYLPSSDNGKSATVFAFPSGGAFVLGDRTAATVGPATSVTWWDAQWSRTNLLSGGSAPSAFKGFANSVTSLPTTSPPAACQGTWTSSGGNSPPPASDVPSYMGVIVSSSITKSGSTVSGNVVKIVVVRTTPGYAPNSGHAGTGTIVATFCS